MDPRMDDVPVRAERRHPDLHPDRIRDRLRDWWWVVLPMVVALSLGISSLGGAHASRVRSGPAVSATHAPGIFRTVVPLDADHRLAVGHHRTRAFAFDTCVASRTDLTKRQAQRYCLAKAHLHDSTPLG